MRDFFWIQIQYNFQYIDNNIPLTSHFQYYQQTEILKTFNERVKCITLYISKCRQADTKISFVINLSCNKIAVINTLTDKTILLSDYQFHDQDIKFITQTYIKINCPRNFFEFPINKRAYKG